MSESDDTKDRRISDLSARVARLEELILRRDIPSIAARAAQHAAPPRGPPGPDVQAAPGPTAAPLEIPGRAPIPPPSIDAAWEAERRIGGHWYAAIGAVVVVVGVALFFELARRNHWFDLIPDAIKCLAGAGFGAALIIAGELLRPRTRAGPQLLTFVPAALCAAGLGSMYASAYAAYGVFGLLGPAAGFALLAANAALGIVLGTRSREAAVTVLSLLGGYATPLLVSAPNPHPLVLPTYLTALLTAGLVVSGLAGGGFVAVRAVAWWGTLFLGGAWALGTGVEHHVIALGFVSGVWALVHAELIWTAERGRLSGDVWPFRAFMPRWGPSRGYAVSISTTAWAASAATIVLRQSEAGPDWTACGVGFVAACLWALLVAGPRRVLREPPETDAQRLGAALMLESGALLIGAIALGFSGSTEIVAWIGLGAAAVAAGSWIRARGLHVYGLVVLGIVTVRLIAHDSWSGGPTVAGEAVAGLYLTRWALFMACVSLAWFGGAFLVLRPHADVGWSAVAAGTGALGAALAFGALLHERAEPRAVALAWMVLSLTIASVGRLDNRLLLDRIGLGGVLAAALAWMIADPPYPARDWERAGAVLVLFSSPFWIGVALAATLAAHAWWLRRVARAPGTNAKWVRFAALACLVTLFAATTSELARWAARLTTDDTARQAAVSIWWGLCGMGLVVVGFLARGALIRRVGLALLATAVGKALVVDLARVELEGRVASFLGLGLLMLGVAVLYNRVTAALARREATQRDREKHAAGGDTPGVV